jgi:hypothetical protein
MEYSLLNPSILSNVVVIKNFMLNIQMGRFFRIPWVECIVDLPTLHGSMKITSLAILVAFRTSL